MIPKKLTLNGFLSYRGEIELDFDQIDLACVIGQNGAGKSSLLDAITWALFGKARSVDDDLINLHQVQAIIWFEFFYEDQLYRIERSKKRGGTKQVLLNVWNPVDEMWMDFSEGTNTATQEKIERILKMDYETFINASFFLQGKADQFAQQRPADRKKTLAKILELDIWEQYRLQVAEKRKKLEMDLGLLDARLEDIENSLSRETELVGELGQLKTRLSQSQDMVETQEKLVEGLKKFQQQVINQKQQLEILTSNQKRALERLKNANSALSETESKQNHYQGLLAVEDKVKANFESWKQQQAELDELDAISLSFNEISKKRELPQQRLIAEESRLNSEVAHLRQAAEEIKIKEKDLAELSQMLIAAREEQAQIKQETSLYISLEETFDAIDVQKRALEPDVFAIRKELQRLKDRKAKLEKLDAVECPTCGQPLTEAHRNEILFELKETHAALREEFESKNSLLETLQEKMSALDQEIRQLKEREERELVKRVNRMIDSYEAKIQTWSEDVAAWHKGRKARLADLEKVLEQQAFCLEERKVLEKTGEELRNMGYDPAKHESLRSQVQAGRQHQQDHQALKEAKGVLVELTKVHTVQKAATVDAEEELKTAEESYQKAKEVLADLETNAGDYTGETRKLMQLRDEQNLTRQSVGAAEQRLNALVEKRSLKETLLQNRKGLTLDIGQHKILEEAFGKNGVPALLIEQALPEIEVQANKVLDRLSTTGMSIQLHTQAEYKDKKRPDLKETLDIIISDEVGVRPYEMYSGGEAFRVNFAIRLALSRMLSARTGARLQTLVIDEGFGSQDADGVQRLVSTINAIKDDFAKIIVITHLEELKGAFPTQIEVIKTPSGSQLVVAQA